MQQVSSVMVYHDASLRELQASVRSALPQWDVPDSAAVTLLTISENATYLVDDLKEPAC